MKTEQVTCYRSRIKNLSDQAGVLSKKELARALAELAFQIDSEAAIIKISMLEYERVK